MAWKEVDPMEERMRFVLRATREEKVFSQLCAEFGISRKTGYKWLERYEQNGMEGIQELTRRPLASPNRIEGWIEEAIIKERQGHRTWGPKKLRHKLCERYETKKIPSVSTIGNVLSRHNLVRKRRRRRRCTGPERGNRTVPVQPNDVWGVDFKGWFYTGDGCRCDPLTVSDLATRFVLACRRTQPTVEGVKPVFRHIFGHYGLPGAISVDNGSPFGSRGVCGLTELSAWWCQLGIRVEFIKPGHPDQNGVHERMHRTLKHETATPPAPTLEAQQRRFDRWRKEFNEERPHEALGMRKPAEWYRRSPRPYRGQTFRKKYPLHYEVRMVRSNGEIKWHGTLYYIGEALHGMALGLTGNRTMGYKVYFGELLLGMLDGQTPGILRPSASEFPES